MPGSLLLHPRTKARIEKFALEPAPAILIAGPSGSGKLSLARQLAAEVLDIKVEKLPDYPYFNHLQTPRDKREISIESVRQVIKDMRLKPVITGQKRAKRVILIENADNLSEEAQNALLKSLEEPADDTVFMLTVEREAALLPTIVSRVQKLAVAPVGAALALEHFKESYSAKDIDSAWQLSQGAAGLLSALLKDEAEHPLKQAVQEAKKFLRMDKYQRALYLDSLSSNKAELKEFLRALGIVLAALHAASVKTGSSSQQKKISAARRLASTAADSLNHNASPRLVCLHLALSLPV